MTKFIAIKVHYDHRDVAVESKYAHIPTWEQYRHYLDLYNNGIGGEGFHECINFMIPREDSLVRIYLPPTCFPRESALDEDFVIFSFTYKADKEMPASIIGVHAEASILSREGITRRDITPIEGVPDLFFHAEAPAKYVTLFSAPLEYDSRDGIYTPRYDNWGNGLRYIDQHHAEKIIHDSLLSAEKQLPKSTGSRRLFIERQIDVLNNIKARHLFVEQGEPSKKNLSRPLPPLPDQELGYLGELAVYNKELDEISKLGLQEKEVRWISQSVPSSPFDIETKRKTSKGLTTHYIEVKSSTAEIENVFVSSYQIDFLETNRDSASIIIVKFDFGRNITGMSEYSITQLYDTFELVPIKYKLSRRI
jgi:hypothetical protein